MQAELWSDFHFLYLFIAISIFSSIMSYWHYIDYVKPLTWHYWAALKNSAKHYCKLIWVHFIKIKTFSVNKSGFLQGFDFSKSQAHVNVFVALPLHQIKVRWATSWFPSDSQGFNGVWTESKKFWTSVFGLRYTVGLSSIDVHLANSSKSQTDGTHGFLRFKLNNSTWQQLITHDHKIMKLCAIHCRCEAYITGNQLLHKLERSSNFVITSDFSSMAEAV